MLIFVFKFNSAKMHSQKSFSCFFCDASVSELNGNTLSEIIIQAAQALTDICQTC